jgi:hypothetical protein
MKKKSNRLELIEATKNGRLSLVVGAGISQPYGIPNWEELAKRMWKSTFPRQASPWKDEGKASTQVPPQLLPMVFELAYRKLGVKEFVRKLCDCMYAGAFHFSKAELQKSSTSLAVLARLVIQEYQLKRDCRISRVITLNADDCLEQAIEFLNSYSGLRNKGKEKVIDTIRSPVDQLTEGKHNKPIPIYHLHGCVPNYSSKIYHLLTPETVFSDQFLGTYSNMLVFTDAQYWSSASSILSFANRTMGAALYDSHCIFIGLSMTDINLLRWLALRHLEFDKQEEQFLRVWVGDSYNKMEIPSWLDLSGIRKNLARHFWIRPVSDDPKGFLSKFLQTRGVRSVEINSWESDDFEKLIRSCFPVPPQKKIVPKNNNFFC